MMVASLSSVLRNRPQYSLPITINCSKLPSNSEFTRNPPLTRRKTIFLSTPFLTLLLNFNPGSATPLLSADALELDDEQEESSVVRLFQVMF